MSWYPDREPICHETSSDTIAMVIDARPRDLGGFMVRRVLPSAKRRLVGPFIFLDHMGPASLPPGDGIDVRPHPHIALATLTYLFDGGLVHRDTLRVEQEIVPGDVNWMVAGRGVAHSERSSDEARRAGAKLHGVQCWIALPKQHEEIDPSFEHHPAATIPRVERDGARLYVIAGEAYGAKAPVSVLSPTFYVHAELEAGAVLPLPADHDARAAYVVEGAIGCDERRFSPGEMPVFRRGADAKVRALEPSRVMLLGGAELEGERHIWWNFVSSSKERIEQAKRDWKEGRFGKIPGDDQEFIPLPEG